MTAGRGRRRPARLACLLLCGACGGPADSAEEGAGPPLPELTVTLTGRIEGWTLGSSFSITAQVAPVGGQGLRPGPVLTQGAVDGEGGFQLELPRKDALTPYLGVLDHTHLKHRDCTVNIHTEPDPLAIAQLVLSVSDGTLRHVVEQEVPGPRDQPGARFTLVTSFYSLQAASAYGIGTCSGDRSSFELIYDWTLRPGWNSSIDRYELSELGFGVSTSRLMRLTAPPPAEARWTLN